jgi:hypothetical protein
MFRARAWVRIALLVALGVPLSFTASHGAPFAPAGAALHAASHRAPQRHAPRHSHHHRAALPRLAHGLRHAAGSKSAPRHAWLPAVGTAEARIAMRAARGLEPMAPSPRIHAVTSARGPPRAGPIGHTRGRASPAPAMARRFDAPPAASAPFRSQHLPLSYPRSADRRLHAVRPEGATACFLMPSIGGTPCPAFEASPRSRSRSPS